MRKFAGVIESAVAPPINCLWVYKGDAKYFSNGKWTSLIGESAGEADRQELEEKVDSLDKEVGNTVNSLRTIEKYYSPIIPLQVGNATEIKQANINNLSTVPSGEMFECEINYGFGVGRVVSGAGTAHVITPDGIIVKYTISNDGSITKISENNLDFKYVLPQASTTAIGGVKKVTAIADIVPESATAESVAYKLNDILAALRQSGILNN